MHVREFPAAKGISLNAENQHVPSSEDSFKEWKPESHAIQPSIALLASIMDDFLQIPGTKVRIGLDGIIGLIPVIGDLITIVVGAFIMREAERLGVSRWTKARMYANYAIDTLVGMIPIVGDAFDFGFKAHRKNLRLLQEHLDSHPAPSTGGPITWLNPKPK